LQTVVFHCEALKLQIPDTLSPLQRASSGVQLSFALHSFPLQDIPFSQDADVRFPSTQTAITSKLQIGRFSPGLQSSGRQAPAWQDSNFGHWEKD
jgi:hypothetical protein